MKFETKIKVAASAIILVMSTVAALPMIVNRHVTTVMSELRSASNVERLQLTLRENIRSCDVACRMGGEEMVVLLPECGIENALKRADALRLAIAGGDVLHGGQRIGATASIGVAAYPEHGNSMQALVHAADLALYEAKHSGRNCVRVAKSDPMVLPSANGHADAART